MTGAAIRPPRRQVGRSPLSVEGSEGHTGEVEPDEQGAAEARDAVAGRRDEAAEARDKAAAARDEAADARDVEAVARDQASRRRRRSEVDRQADRLADRQGPAEAETDQPGAVAGWDATDQFLDRLRQYETAVIADRSAAAADRRAAAEDRRAATRDREVASRAREQAAVEAAQLTSEELARLVTPVTGSPTEAGAETEARRAEVARSNLAESGVAGLESIRYAADLAGEVADTEERIARILKSLASHGDPKASARRLALADEATKEMHAATERGERLRSLAVRVSDGLATAALRTLVNHAAATCAALVETERAIAGALESLAASRHSPEDAAARRMEAEKARAAAETVAKRAEELRLLQRLTGSADAQAETRAEAAPDEE